MTTFLSAFFREDSGATAIEYGLIVALIAVFIITGLTLVSGNVNAVLTRLADLFAGGALD